MDQPGGYMEDVFIPDTPPREQVLLDQALGCIDAALAQVAHSREDLMTLDGLSAYTVGQILNRLAGAAGDIATCQRLLPGYKVER